MCLPHAVGNPHRLGGHAQRPRVCPPHIVGIPPTSFRCPWHACKSLPEAHAVAMLVRMVCLWHWQTKRKHSPDLGNLWSC